MGEVAVSAEGLGKQYHIGEWTGYRTLRESILSGLRKTCRRCIPSQPPATTSRRTIWALRDVTFEVRRGEVVGIIGRNGAGKSTLLKLLARITTPTEGSAVVRGRVGSLLEVGTGFHPELTGRENLFLNGAILGMKRREIQRKFDQIVAFAEIQQFIDTPVKRYSSGMYMRLAFAVAAHLEPDILVVDEVLAVGDASFQRKCLAKMEDVSHQGRTVLFVSHNLPAITRLCQRAMLLDQGRIVQDGLASDVVDTYLGSVVQSGHSRHWDIESCPGTEQLKLIRVAVCQARKPASLVSLDQPVDLTITYWVRTARLSVRCSAAFRTQGVCAFVTLEPFEKLCKVPGVYCSTVRIPPHLLAEGEYTIDVSIFSSRGAKLHYATAKDAAAIHVTDPIDGSTARGDYTDKLSGVVRPKLAWTTTYAGEELNTTRVQEWSPPRLAEVA